MSRKVFFVALFVACAIAAETEINFNFKGLIPSANEHSEPSEPCEECEVCEVCPEAPVYPGIATLLNADFLTTLKALIEDADLTDDLVAAKNITVFAPTNEAFAALNPDVTAIVTDPTNINLLVKILSHHIVPAVVPAESLGGIAALRSVEGEIIEIGETIGGAGPVAVNIFSSTGIVHVIDSVLLPTFNLGETLQLNSLTTLLTAIVASNISSQFSSENEYTIFAPSNEAFAALPEGTLANLLLPENREALRGLLSLHATAGRVYSSALNPNEPTTITTLSGQQISLSVSDVDAADIEASNGVIHIINKVLSAN